MGGDPLTWGRYGGIASKSVQRGYRLTARWFLAVPPAGHQPRAQVRRHRRDHAHRLLVLRDRHHDLTRVQLQSRRIGTRHELDLARAPLARLVAVDVVAE